jgi:ABC-type multidrug transport system fused ATPase/permease subunit
MARSSANLPMALTAFTLIQSAAKNLRLNVNSIFQQTGDFSSQLSNLRAVYAVSEIKNKIIDGTEGLDTSREGISLEFKSVLSPHILGMFLIALRDVSFKYPGSNTYALQHVSFRVQQGQLCVRDWYNWLHGLSYLIWTRSL